MFNTLSDRDNDVRLAVIGEFDVATEAAWNESVSNACSSAEYCVTLDLGGVTFIDSTGLRLLLKAHDTAADHGVYIVLANVPPKVTRLFDICGLAHLFHEVTRSDTPPVV